MDSYSADRGLLPLPNTDLEKARVYPVPVFIGLGSNLANPLQQVTQAISELSKLPDTQIKAVSGLYQTPAWGDTEQPDFINAAVELHSTLAPLTLLNALQAIETEHGRQRDPLRRWGARHLDLDILLYGDYCISAPSLQVPHPYLSQRAFVLIPLAEIAPQQCIGYFPEPKTVFQALLALGFPDIQPTYRFTVA